MNSINTEEKKRHKVRMATIIGVAVIVIGMLFTARPYSIDLKVRKPTQKEIGQLVNICTVANVKFMISKDTPVIDCKGKTYYFCCTHCLGEFQTNPDKFANPDVKEDAG